MIKKFFVLTRGRTGSTAVMDELNKVSAIRATQELFLIRDFSQIPDAKFAKLFDILLPFDLWKQKSKLYKWMLSILDGDKIWINLYLYEAEGLAKRQSARAFCFKVLSHHFDERPLLSTVLKERGYQVIYLTRNIARQVLSGMVAAQTGVYNTTEDVGDTRRHQIDLEKFRWLVQWEVQCVEKDIARLKAERFDFIVVSYEEFNNDRQSFYKKIFHFLGLAVELPLASDYAVIIKDLKYTIENYDAVADCVSALGMSLD